MTFEQLRNMPDFNNISDDDLFSAYNEVIEVVESDWNDEDFVSAIEYVLDADN